MRELAPQNKGYHETCNFQFSNHFCQCPRGFRADGWLLVKLGLVSPHQRWLDQPVWSGVLTITNQSGTVYSLGELDQQLRDLQAAVERALPPLTAFNTTYAATNSSGGAAGALGDLLRVFRKN